MKKKVLILSWHDISSAYSCLKYLKEELEKDGTKVLLWSKTKLDNKKENKKNGYYSFLWKWYGHLKKIRYVFACVDVFFKSLFSKSKIIIVNDWDFFIPVYYARKINKSITFIHYNTEISGEDVKINKRIEKFYSKHANAPDMIIECLKERAIWRKHNYKIKQDIYYINNTIPLTKISSINQIDSNNVELINKLNNCNLPILIYAGRASVSRNLQDLIDLIPKFKDKVFFLFFCYGTSFGKKQLNEYVEKNCKCDNYIIHDSVAKDELLSIMNYCDIGINYYLPNISINHKYASPSKFFEYLACGLNVISTNNEGINNIINNEEIGVCINETETLEDALKRLLKKGLKEKNAIKQLFIRNYCYEVDSKNTIDKIKSYL